MTELPRVSVVTPSYNQAQFLEATLRSVLEQEYPRLEYIVNDGGSTDGSVDIIARYASQLAYWVSERDKGQSDAINKGWQRATGEIVAWLNSDDTYLPGAIRTAVDFFQTHPDVGIVYSDCPLIDAQGKRIGLLGAERYAMETLVFGNYIPQSTVFIRRAVLERIGLLDPTMHYAMDYDYWVRAALYFQFAVIPQELATYRWHDAGKILTRPDASVHEYIAILKRTFDDPAFPPHLLHLRARALGSCYLRWGLYCFTAELPKEGAENIAAAFREDESLATDTDYVRDTLAYHIVNVLPSRAQVDDHSERETGAWLEGVYQNWASDARAALPARSAVLAQAALIRGFDAHKQGNLEQAGLALWQAVRQQPRYLKNRGVVSILWKAATRPARAQG